MLCMVVLCLWWEGWKGRIATAAVHPEERKAVGLMRLSSNSVWISWSCRNGGR